MEHTTRIELENLKDLYLAEQALSAPRMGGDSPSMMPSLIPGQRNSVTQIIH